MRFASYSIGIRLVFHWHSPRVAKGAFPCTDIGLFHDLPRTPFQFGRKVLQIYDIRQYNTSVYTKNFPALANFFVYQNGKVFCLLL